MNATAAETPTVNNFITDLPPSIKLKVKTLLMVTNRLNKGIILILILSISTSAVATAFIKHYVPYHGFSKAIINNKGTQFTNAIWAILYKTLGIKHRLSSAYHPEMDRATERANQIIQPYLHVYTTFSQDN